MQYTDNEAALIGGLISNYRLIEQQDVRVAEQCARQQDFDLFAAV